MAAGAAAGLCQFVATTPMEIVKINSQMAAQHAKLTGKPMQSSLEIVRELGLRGVYKGAAATLLRDIPFSFVFFPLSSWLKEKAAERAGPGQKAPVVWVFAAGVGAGMVAAGAVTPCDVIKTRLQTRQVGVQYAGIRDAAVKIYLHDGVGAFFKGAP